jgi:hypothetical protein
MIRLLGESGVGGSAEHQHAVFGRLQKKLKTIETSAIYY